MQQQQQQRLKQQQNAALMQQAMLLQQQQQSLYPHHPGLLAAPQVLNLLRTRVYFSDFSHIFVIIGLDLSIYLCMII
jgi:hypothetical protein